MFTKKEKQELATLYAQAVLEYEILNTINSDVTNGV
jgi:flagellar basal body-associated protein FliL